MGRNIREARRNFMKKSAYILGGMHLLLESCIDINEDPDNQKLNRFQELKLYVEPSKLTSQKTFYTSKLNLPLVSEEANMFTIKAGETLLSFSANEDYKEPFYHFAFNIPENKVAKARDWTKNRFHLLQNDYGEELIHFKKWNARSIYFMDPAGNILEFIGHHKMKNGRSGGFSEKDILYVIEIGLVTKDVKQLSADIKKEIGLSDYIKADSLLNSSKFRALGDTSGMFILSKTDRDWLMTELPAGEFPLELKMRSHRKETINLSHNKFRIELS